MKKPRQSGFTLIELMVTVAIVGILAAIGYPSYRAYIARGHRADAKAVLLENAQFLERNFTEANKYHQTSAGAGVALPYTQSPKIGTAIYTVSATTLNATQFTLRALPVAGGPMDNDGCGNFTYNQQGVKAVSGSLGVSGCWGR